MNFFLAKIDITVCTCSANLPFYKRQTNRSTVDENKEKSESAFILGVLCLPSFVYKALFFLFVYFVVCNRQICPKSAHYNLLSWVM